jgi:antitoxin component of RelBE/YafQ-DinJ toxin-antitoxin module
MVEAVMVLIHDQTLLFERKLCQYQMELLFTETFDKFTIAHMERTTKTTITLEVDLKTLSKAEKILSALPCSLDYAFNLFLGQVVKEGMLPFGDSTEETQKKQMEDNLRLAYGEVNYLDTATDEGLFDLGPED